MGWPAQKGLVGIDQGTLRLAGPAATAGKYSGYLVSPLKGVYVPGDATFQFNLTFEHGPHFSGPFFNASEGYFALILGEGGSLGLLRPSHKEKQYDSLGQVAESPNGTTTLKLVFVGDELSVWANGQFVASRSAPIFNEHIQFGGFYAGEEDRLAVARLTVWTTAQTAHAALMPTVVPSGSPSGREAYNCPTLPTKESAATPTQTSVPAKSTTVAPGNSGEQSDSVSGTGVGPDARRAEAMINQSFGSLEGMVGQDWYMNLRVEKYGNAMFHPQVHMVKLIEEVGYFANSEGGKKTHIYIVDYGGGRRVGVAFAVDPMDASWSGTFDKTLSGKIGYDFSKFIGADGKPVESHLNISLVDPGASLDVLRVGEVVGLLVNDNLPNITFAWDHKGSVNGHSYDGILNPAYRVLIP